WCMVIGGSRVELTVFDKAGNFGKDSTEGASADTTAPMITMTSPSGIIKYNEVTLEVDTNEPAKCYYGETDDIKEMALMPNTPLLGDYGTEHNANLETLEDGLYVYHVQCEDASGNWNEHSKTIVFSINTAGDWCVYKPLTSGWDVVYLPDLMLDDLYGNLIHTPEQVLYEIAGNYDIIWYYDGTQWLHYEPDVPSWANTLTEFNDKISNPYYLKMTGADTLTLPCNQLDYCGNGKVDVPFGEECDDGNKENGDGCSSTCTVEISEPV
ncbi:MAG: myxococcus cysteine-rich repeat containing protein, partial [Candidatus Woesearchaeota archaeon]|nr:myxococcus cysteine-rich repeat containing protein [Candidatus Woesearchaeota archaeon]